MDDFVSMQVSKATQDLTTDVSNPVITQRVALGRLDQFCYRPCSTELHHQPQLVVLAIRALLDERSVVRRNVSMMRVLQSIC